MNWEDAKTFCQNKGSDLLSINNQDEQDFVTALLGGEEYIIGEKLYCFFFLLISLRDWITM